MYREICDYFFFSKYLVGMMSCIVFYALFPAIAPTILNRIMSVENGTYKKSLAFYIEYFIDEEEYFVLLLLHTVFVGVIVSLFTGSIIAAYIICISHIIATFNAVG